MKPLLSMRAALSDPDLFGSVLVGDSWHGWSVLLIAVMGEPLLDDELPVFKALTGRDYLPGHRVEEFWAIVGRRSGKTRAAAVLAVYHRPNPRTQASGFERDRRHDHAGERHRHRM